MTGTDRVWDRGLQPERTALAWRRLALAWLGLAPVMLRLAWNVVGAWALVPACLLVAASVTLMVEGRRRYLSAHRRLRSGREALPDGRLPFVTLCTTLVLVAVSLAIVLG